MCRHSHKNDRFSKEIRKIAKITLVVSEKNRIFALQLRRLVALLENKASFIHSLAQPLHRLSEERTFGQIPEWPNGADCKSAVFRLRWFESIFAHKKRGAHSAPRFCFGESIKFTKKAQFYYGAASQSIAAKEC